MSAAACCGPADEAAVVALWERAGLVRPWNDAAADYRRAIAGPSSAVLAIRADEGIVAAVMVGDDGHRGWFYYLAVDAARRGTGLGRAIVAAGEAWLRARGVAAVRLMVRRDNHAATGFYAAIGYDGQDVATLGRRLDGNRPPMA